MYTDLMSDMPKFNLPNYKNRKQHSGLVCVRPGKKGKLPKESGKNLIKK